MPSIVYIYILSSLLQLYIFIFFIKLLNTLRTIDQREKTPPHKKSVLVAANMSIVEACYFPAFSYQSIKHSPPVSMQLPPEINVPAASPKHLIRQPKSRPRIHNLNSFLPKPVYQNIFTPVVLMKHSSGEDQGIPTANANHHKNLSFLNFLMELPEGSKKRDKESLQSLEKIITLERNKKPSGGIVVSKKLKAKYETVDKWKQRYAQFQSCKMNRNNNSAAQHSKINAHQIDQGRNSQSKACTEPRQPTQPQAPALELLDSRKSRVSLPLIKFKSNSIHTAVPSNNDYNIQPKNSILRRNSIMHNLKKPLHTQMSDYQPPERQPISEEDRLIVPEILLIRKSKLEDTDRKIVLNPKVILNPQNSNNPKYEHAPKYSKKVFKTGTPSNRTLYIKQTLKDNAEDHLLGRVSEGLARWETDSDTNQKQ